MIKVIQPSEVEDYVNQKKSCCTVVVIFSSVDHNGIPLLSSLADDLQHRLINVSPSNRSVEVVIASHLAKKNEANIWHDGRLLHTIIKPCARSVTEAYRIALGHYHL
jgi:hypothetical protein